MSLLSPPTGSGCTLPEPARSNAAQIQANHPKGLSALSVMNRHLEHQDFFTAPDRYGVADIALYAYTHVADQGGYDVRPVSSRQQLARARQRAAPIHCHGCLRLPMRSILFLLGDSEKAHNDNHLRLPAAFSEAGWDVVCEITRSRCDRQQRRGGERSPADWISISSGRSDSVAR